MRSNSEKRRIITGNNVHTIHNGTRDGMWAAASSFVRVEVEMFSYTSATGSIETNGVNLTTKHHVSNFDT